MITIPETLEETTEQAIAATMSAIAAGCKRIQIDMKFPELAQMPIALAFAEAFTKQYGQAWQALFADAGTAALAKRDWANSDILREVSMRGVNEGRAAARPESQAFLLISPTSVEVDGIEKLLTLIGDRPFVMLNPKLENSEVGLGLAARRMRDRFLSIFEIVYYIQPIEEGAVWRCYPQLWQVWQDKTTGMELIYEGEERPVGDDLNRIMGKATGKKPSLITQLQQFINALAR
ncbi:protein of unknown function (DUF1995) [Synechococcus sp. PCC 7502]|uniref:DUF1995 family protein n=1 Tax=Synechococcus sp. PCC 7502 TaxID=1173263 RepID=UPI00029F8ECC|nr:DUF1995 family protein [Synechococcus sp. PCC 7502]AFY72373.1 protein of unknown function (DUF1995) [Synechococcus sp. PCC 7502]